MSRIFLNSEMNILIFGYLTYPTLFHFSDEDSNHSTTQTVLSVSNERNEYGDSCCRKWMFEMSQLSGSAPSVPPTPSIINNASVHNHSNLLWRRDVVEGGRRYLGIISRRRAFGWKWASLLIILQGLVEIFYVVCKKNSSLMTRIAVEKIFRNSVRNWKINCESSDDLQIQLSSCFSPLSFIEYLVHQVKTDRCTSFRNDL